jgi:hypothetical protein
MGNILPMNSTGTEDALLAEPLTKQKRNAIVKLILFLFLNNIREIVLLFSKKQAS